LGQEARVTIAGHELWSSQGRILVGLAPAKGGRGTVHGAYDSDSTNSRLARQLPNPPMQPTG